MILNKEIIYDFSEGSSAGGDTTLGSFFKVSLLE
jgi:hypothetical protein